MPVLAVCGYSGSGKTTLIERLVPELRAAGWRVAVVKRTRHVVAVDVAGKDSDRFFRAGASVCLESRGEAFARTAAPTADGAPWQRTVRSLVAGHDFVLVEGHKETPLPKVWLRGPMERAPPSGIANVLATLDWDDDRVPAIRALCHERAALALAARPLLGAVLLDRDGDRARAAAAVAALARHVGETVIVGDHDAPSIARLPSVPAVTPRSLAHTLAPLRWAPDASWLVVRPGPGLTSGALAALVAQRRPGRWVIEAAGGVDATIYEPQARAALEDDVVAEIAGARIGERTITGDGEALAASVVAAVR